jgi:multidrug efflux pump subunit AcrB
MAPLVTTPIENRLRNITGLRELNSRSINGYMRILAWFHYDSDMTIALDQVKQQVGSIRKLPEIGRIVNMAVTLPMESNVVARPVQ